MIPNNKHAKIIFILGAILGIIASALKVSNIGIADYILGSGIFLMVSAAAILYYNFAK